MNSPDNTTDDKSGEKPFEPTDNELRKQIASLDNLIRQRSGKLKEEQTENTEPKGLGEDEGFLPPFNSAF